VAALLHVQLLLPRYASGSGLDALAASGKRACGWEPWRIFRSTAILGPGGGIRSHLRLSLAGLAVVEGLGGAAQWPSWRLATHVARFICRFTEERVY
jgi:hypothetical protein